MLRLTLPSIFPNSSLAKNITNIRDQITHRSSETVTGLNSDPTKLLNGQIGKAMLLDKAIQDIETERSGLELRDIRLNLMQQSLTNVRTQAQELGTRAQAAIGLQNQGQMITNSNDAKAALKEIFASLSIKQGERYLFSGDATATSPFGETETLLDDLDLIARTATSSQDFATALDFYFNDPAGGWQQSIYNASDTASTPNDLTGNNPALKQIISGLAVIALSKPNEALTTLDHSGAILSSGVNSINAGIQSLTLHQSVLGIEQAAIENNQKSLDAEQTIFTSAFTDLIGKDQYEAAAQLRELETQLETAYTLTGRLANLTLVNFLR